MANFFEAPGWGKNFETTLTVFSRKNILCELLWRVIHLTHRPSRHF